MPCFFLLIFTQLYYTLLYFTDLYTSHVKLSKPAARNGLQLFCFGKYFDRRGDVAG
jgi:hypothetical protein